MGRGKGRETKGTREMTGRGGLAGGGRAASADSAARDVDRETREASRRPVGGGDWGIAALRLMGHLRQGRPVWAE
jgi:hypothetical protein